MYIIGINAYHADVSAVLLQDGNLVCAVEEERFRRLKHCAGFPRLALRHAVSTAGIRPTDIDYFAVSRQPRAHLWRKVLFSLRYRPGWDLIRRRLSNAGQVTGVAEEVAATLQLDLQHVRHRLRWVEHHPAHLASTFFVSPFEEAAVCAIDGFGDFVSTSWAMGRGNQIQMLRRIYFPHSLGELYLALTQFLGFAHYGDEFKVMGLAPYGRPRYVEQVRRLLHLLETGGFRLELDYFQHWSRGDQMSFDEDRPRIGPVFSQRLEQLLGPPRAPETPLESRHEDLAASLQAVFEEAYFHVLNGLFQATRSPRLCLAGGCAMNSVANGKIRENTPFDEVYIQPAAADNGTALGAAFHVWHQTLGRPRGFVMDHGYWGPQFSDQEIAREAGIESISEAGCKAERKGTREVLSSTAAALAQGQVVGWFQGRMEWGARALGNRSILADPRRSNMRDIINRKIKFREKFRPFAPAVLKEALDTYFDGAVPDPFMQQVYPVRPEKRAEIPAVTHVDGSGRLQTVSEASNNLFWRLIKEFERLTGVPVLLNTSFNENEPIVLRPSEALDCFLRTGMDLLVMGNWMIEKRSPAKSAQNAGQRRPADSGVASG